MWYKWKTHERAILIGITVGLLVIVLGIFQTEANLSGMEGGVVAVLSAVAIGVVAFVSAWRAQDAERHQEEL